MEAELKGTTKDPPERWLVTVCILYASGSTGLIYLNSVYSEALKAKHSLTQSDVETISAVMFSAGMLSTLPGALVDRIGPRLGVRLGGTVMTTCFLLEFCVCVDVFGGSPKPGLVVGALSTLGAIQFLGSAMVTASVFPTVSAIYQPYENRGFVVGEAKAWVGLFGAIVTQVYVYAVGATDDSAQTFNFLLFLAAAAFGLTFVPSLIVTKHPKKTRTAHLFRLYLMVAVVVVAGATCVAGALIGSTSGDDDDGDGDDDDDGGDGGGGDDDDDDDTQTYPLAQRVPFIVLCLALLAFPAVTLLNAFESAPERRFSSFEDNLLSEEVSEAIDDSPAAKLRQPDESGDESVPSPEKRSTATARAAPNEPTLTIDSAQKEVIRIVSRNHTGALPQNVTGTPSTEYSVRGDLAGYDGAVTEMSTGEMVRSPRCWMLLWCTMSVIGSGIFVTTNAAQMMVAVGGEKSAGSTAVTLFSVAQALGRLGSGMAADAVKTRLRLPSSSVLVVSTALMALAQATMSTAGSAGAGIIFGGVVCAGLGFGIVWPLIVVLAGDFFGLENLGANYSFYDGLSSALGALCFALLLPSYFYRQHRTTEDDDGGDDDDGKETCTVPACFRMAYVIMAILNSLAVVCALALTRSARMSSSGGGGGGGGRAGHYDFGSSKQPAARRLDAAFESAEKKAVYAPPTETRLKAHSVAASSIRGSLLESRYALLERESEYSSVGRGGTQESAFPSGGRPSRSYSNALTEDDENCV